jgi:hypothetical protein
VKKLLGPLFAALFGGALLTYGVGQEIPVGRLAGRVTMRENGRPIPDALVTLTLRGQKDDERPQVKGVETDEKGNYAFPALAAGDYDLDVSAKEHNIESVRVTISEGKVAHRDVKAKPNEPYLNLYASQKVFLPNETPRVELHGFVPQRDVRMRVIRLNEDAIAKQGGYTSAIGPLARGEGTTTLAEAGESVLDTQEAVKERDAEGAFVTTLPVGSLKEGVYFVDVRAGEQRANTVLLVSRLALVAKTGADGTLLYATDLAAGTPVEGAQVSEATEDGLRVVGKTGADGTLQTKLVSVKNRQTVLARQGDSVAIVDSYRNEEQAKDVWIAAYTERPAYRPGDTVYFKGFVRRTDGDGYRLPGQGNVSVTITDPDNNELQTLSLPLSVHGSFNGSFTTSKESKPGGYGIACKAFGGESQGAYANVVAYRKPEFSIEVKPAKDHYAMGDRAAATVECKYYYGGPVVGAKVKATVYRSPVFFYEDEEGEMQSGDSYGAGEYSQEVEAVTDAAGRARIEFDTRAENDPEFLTNDYQYTVSASVTEDGGKYFDGEGQVRVTRGDFGMSLEVQNPILVPGDTAEVLVTTTDAVDSKKPLGGQTVAIEAGRMAYAKGGSTFVSRQRFTVTTDAQGKATLRVPVTDAESLTFRAKAQDSARRTIVAEAWAYVEGSPALAEAERGSLKLTLDKRNYAEGDRAKALIETDAPGGTALVCVQTDRVLWRKMVALKTGSTIVEVPVIKEYAPNVYISVAFVHDKHFFQSDRRLRVSREDRRLNIEVKPAKDTYKPGQTAQVIVRTTDADGKPLPAEISVGTVDRGVYDVAQDETDLYASLYPERSNGVQTDYSFPEIYLDGGDKGSSKIPLRTEFRDTAAWSPTVWTGESGEATVEVPLPDNLTEWRVTAIGMSDASQTGMTTTSFKVRKPLMVRLGLPQFLVEGDHQRLTAIVANDTGKDADVKLNLEVDGLKTDDQPAQTVRVPAGEPQTVEFNVDALGAGTATVTARAEIEGGENDGVQQSFPILAHGRPTLETRAGEGSANFDLALPENLDPKIGDLKVTVSPTLAGDLSNALDGLIKFPYGCVEQTMSRFLPAVLVEKTVRDLGLPKPKNLDNLPEIVRDSLARLARMRNGNGGWGWWEYDEPDPFMTALVLDGLDRAKRAGYDVDVADPNSAVRWAKEYLGDRKRSKDITTRDRLYLIYALLRWGEKDAAARLDGINLRDHTEKLYGEKVERPTSAELATAALAYHEAGRDPSRLLDRLVKRARIGEETVDWGSEEGAWGEEPTALALVALQTARPDDPLLPRIVRGLMASRKGYGWNSTRDTAYALVGLTAYLDHTKELATPASAQVFVNGKSFGPFALDPRGKDPTRTVQIPRAELGDKPIHIEVRATGKVYRTVALAGFETTPKLEAKTTDRGLVVDRKTFLMEPRRASDGEMRLLPSSRPITEFKNGDVVRVELTIRSDVPRDYVLVEEPTPSSCRVTERTELDQGEEKTWWWSRTVVLDDHLAFFARSLPKGESKIVYYMRAEAAGRASALPARAANMYDPGRWASTAETRVEVSK